MNGLVYRLGDLNYRVINTLKDHVESRGFSVEEPQIKSWKACLEFLYKQLYEYKDEELYIVLEYFLPLEGGRRPDILVLYKNKVVVLEFKNKDNFDEDDIQQTIGYREDLKNYHKYIIESNLDVEAYLVLTKGNKEEVVNGIKVLNQNNFKRYINLKENVPMSKDKADNFIISEYEPLPDILKATYDLFNKGKLPYINNIKNGEIEKTYNLLRRIVFNNMTKDNRKNIIFIGGVPGSGKTLVALKLLYKYNDWIKNDKEHEGKSIYISGNGPLVNVLQYQIGKELGNVNYGKGYIKGAKDFKDEFSNIVNISPYNIVLFDEAQRAWDAYKMKMNGVTEPGLLLCIGNRTYNKSGNVNIVCFIGEGQFIHEGEEEGIKLWVNELMNEYKDYNVHIPKEFVNYFKGVSNVSYYNSLYLDTSIRNNFIDISRFVEAILECDKETASVELRKIKEQGFAIKVTRSFDRCRRYTLSKFKEGIKYGILVSSKSDINYIRKKINNGRFKSYIDAKYAGKWFLEDCTKLDVGASEFTCQGLEIDLPIVMFADDFYIKDGKFFANKERIVDKIKNYKDPESIMENIYRVLLTRSRKGMVLFVPDDGFLDETYRFFRDIGILDIDI